MKVDKQHPATSQQHTLYKACKVYAVCHLETVVHFCVLLIKISFAILHHATKDKMACAFLVSLF